MFGYRRSYLIEAVFLMVGIFTLMAAQSCRAQEISRTDVITIQMITTPGCIRCEYWKSQAKPALSQFFNVFPDRYALPSERITIFPTFVVQGNGKTVAFSGYHGLLQHKRRLRLALDQLGYASYDSACYQNPRVAPYEGRYRPLPGGAIPLYRAPVREAIWRFFRPRAIVDYPCPRCGRYH